MNYMLYVSLVTISDTSVLFYENNNVQQFLIKTLMKKNSLTGPEFMEFTVLQCTDVFFLLCGINLLVPLTSQPFSFRINTAKGITLTQDSIKLIFSRYYLNDTVIIFIEEHPLFMSVILLFYEAI